MNHSAFFELLQTNQTGTLYLFEGTEEYIKQQALVRLCKKLLPGGLEQMNYADLADPDPDELIAACETLPFMADRRVVVARDCSPLVSGKKAENDAKAQAYLDYMDRLPATVCLIFCVKGKGDARKRLYTQLKKRGAIVDFSPMSDAECADWCSRAMRQMGKRLSPAAASKLVFTVGRDAALLRQEMDKLRAYLGEREEVTDSDIDDICTRSAECTVFQMVDAQVAGKTAEAFRLLGDMVEMGEDRVGILAMLLRQYRILYHMRCLMEERVPQSAQASLLGIPPFAVQRTQAQARLYQKEQLKQAYDMLIRFEYELKTGRLPQECCAENALLMLEGALRGDDVK